MCCVCLCVGMYTCIFPQRSEEGTISYGIGITDVYEASDEDAGN